MKRFILTLFLLSTFIANAQTADQVVYSLQDMQINSASLQLPVDANIRSGLLIVDLTAKQLKLQIDQVEITLPIDHIGRGYCGGKVIGAQLDQPFQAGTVHNAILIFDDNNNECEPSEHKTIEPVLIQFTEQRPTDVDPIVSTMDGIVTQP